MDGGIVSVTKILNEHTLAFPDRSVTLKEIKGLSPPLKIVPIAELVAFKVLSKYILATLPELIVTTTLTQVFNAVVDPTLIVASLLEVSNI